MPAPITLPHKWVTTLHPTAPFNFDATVHKPSHFPSADNAWEPGVRWQTMLWQDRPLGLKLENAGTVAQPKVKLSVWSQAPLSAAFRQSLRAEIDYRYNLNLDLAPFTKTFKNDPQLGPVLRHWRGMRPMSASSLYEYLIIAIVLQNATVRRSVNMLQALFDAYGVRLAYGGRELAAFWPPAALGHTTEAELRQLKVGYRAKSFLRVTEAFTRGDLDELALRMQPLEVQREALLGLYGVGPASVGYLLFDIFHQWDELSHISPWEQKIYSKLFLDRNPEKPVPVEKLLALFEQRFSGYKMLAVHYLWEDLFWQRKASSIAWLEALIRL
jgi:3-methyladenine DNA glycosylase/8-oxoguanine DNA glycosylase